MNPLSNSFPGAFRKFRHRPEFKAGMAAAAWHRVVGPDVARHTDIQRIDYGIAWISASSSAWGQQVMLLKSVILQRLADELGPNVITDLRLLPGLTKAQPTRTAEPPRPRIELSAAEEQSIETCLAEIEDPAMRKAFRKAMETVYQRRRQLGSEGWLTCARCGAMTEDAERICFICRYQEREKRRSDVRRSLREGPWQTYLDLKMKFPDLTLQEHGHIRGQLLRGYWNDLVLWQSKHGTGPLPEDMHWKLMCYVMLRSGLPPQRLTPEVFERYAGARLKRLATGDVKPPLRRQWGSPTRPFDTR